VKTELFQRWQEMPFDPIEPTEKEARSPSAAHFSAGINTSAPAPATSAFE